MIYALCYESRHLVIQLCHVLMALSERLYALLGHRSVASLSRLADVVVAAVGLMQQTVPLFPA